MGKQNSVAFEFCEMQYDADRLRIISYGDNSRQSITRDNIDDYSATNYRYFKRDSFQYGAISFAIGVVLHIVGMLVGVFVAGWLGSTLTYIGMFFTLYFLLIYFFEFVVDLMFGTNITYSLLKIFFGTECIYVEVYSKNGNNSLEFYIGEEEGNKLENTMKTIKNN